MTCQVPGCTERPEPWAIEIDLDSILVRIYLCRRHELDLRSAPLAIARRRVEA